MTKRLITIIICCTGFSSLVGQNLLTDNILWTATTLSDLNHNTTVNAPCQFKTMGAQIDWIQGNGSYITSFSVQNTSGAWPDVSKSGSVIFSVTSDGLTGNMTWTRDSSGLSVKLVLSGGTDPINILYTISTFQKL